jgi:hypothetical protein
MQKRINKLPELASTFSTIENWYKHIFEKMGWIVLAAGKGHEQKVQGYKKEISQLIKVIDHVSQEYTDNDRLHDMNVMRMNVEYLQLFVENHCCN